MPPVIQSILFKVRDFFKDMAANIMIIYAEKGFLPFKKPLMIAGPTLLVLYAGVYRPISGRLATSREQLQSMQTVAQHADSYEEAKTKLSAYQRKLPLAKDKDEWLSYVITNTARTSGVSIDSLSSQTEIEAGTYLVASRTVSMTTSYAKLGKWLAEVENSQIFLRVSDLTVRRDEGNSGALKASCTLSTIFSKFAGGSAAAGGGTGA